MFKRDWHNCYHCYNTINIIASSPYTCNFHTLARIICAKFTIGMPCIFLKPEPSTEVSAETVKTTKAPETAEATPGRFSFFGFHFGTVAAFAFVSMFKVWESPAQLPSQFLDRFSCWLTSSASPCSAAEGEPKYSKLDFDFCANIFKRISHS